MINELTIFYSKSTGQCRQMCGGVQTFDLFGDAKVDFEQIYERIVVPYDDFLANNTGNFWFENGNLVYKQPYTKPTEYTIKL